MPNKLVRTLYVGVGGTGFKAIIQTKRYFAETYGKDKIPPVVAFLAIDTDGGEPNADPVVRLEPDEIVSISVQKPKTYYNNNQDAFGWLPDENVSAMSRMTKGAGQVRTNGRFAITINYQEVKNRISDALSKITSATSESEDGSWELESDVDIKVHLVFSLCGGTGCGTFLNLAYIIRTAVPGCTLKAYAVLPDVFRQMGGSMALVGANAYGALYDLDYFMTMLDGKSGGLPYELQMYDSRILNQRPFDSVYLIDNKNKNGDSYSKLDQIQKMIGLVLYTSAGELSHAIDTQMDNFEKVSDGLAVRDKQAWVTGTGLCELLINPETLKKIYSIKAASLLVDKMLSAQKTSQDAENKVRTWIDSHSIRENEDNDQLLDSIFDLGGLRAYVNEISDESVRSVVSDWVNRRVPDTKDLNETKENRLKEIKAAFDESVNEILNEEGGIPYAKDFLDKLMSEVKEFKREMEEEKQTLADEKEKAEQARDEAINRMLKGKGLFRRASSFYPEINSKVNNLVNKAADLARHEAAFQFFTAFAEYIGKKQDCLKEIASMLDAAKTGFADQISEIENAKNKNPFQIDLTSRLVKTVDPSNDPDIKVSVYVKSLNTPEGLFSFVGKKTESIVNSLIFFSRSLDANRKYDKVTIESVLREIKDESEDAFRSIIKKALKKSDVLLQTDNGGRMPRARGAQPLDALYIAVKDKDLTILDTDVNTKSLIKAESDAAFANIPNDKSIVFLRQVGVMPAYQVTGVMKYEPEYTELSETMNFHIDEPLYRLMQQKKFKLEPSGSDEDDVLEVWVKGFVHNLIRHLGSGQQYEIQSEMAGGLARNDYWFPLDTKGTEARADAYERFKSMTKVLKEDLLPKIQDRENALGYEKCREIYTELLRDQNKYREVAHLCIELTTLGRPGYERTGELYEKERAYLKSLVESYDNK